VNENSSNVGHDAMSIAKVTNVSREVVYDYTTDGCYKLLQNFSNYSPNGTTIYPRSLESSDIIDLSLYQINIPHSNLTCELVGKL
jgi:hypothetical protein